MKHIKQYEENKPKPPKYKIGDYVLLNTKRIREEYPVDRYSSVFPYYKNYGIIMSDAKILSTHDFMYDISAINSKTLLLTEIAECYISENNMKRKLTQEEIEDFKMIVDSNKYGI